MPPPIVVFDLDGTLVHTAPDLIDSLNHALASAGVGAVNAEGFHRYVGQGARAMIERAYSSTGREAATKEIDALLDRFLVHYRQNMPGKSRPYDGVLAAIDDLKSAGFLVAVCTNKTEHNAVDLLQALKIDKIFSAICGQDTFTVRKPDPAHLTGTIDRAGGDRNRAVMLGDSETDIVTAKAAGIPVVAVDFGYTERDVCEFKPDRIISHYAALDTELVNELINAAVQPC
ncbi:phosphoglycolate phosphatase [Oricola cellulosilytica]|uniref:Phosphoglycolate phosphatase n=1 Tax=Oricola cellulosilytica TaxID=1429082 RepID=A0A4V2MN87_9HYPH|nr:phosphoglycolate phosphatase [Oricola cellulosilytica]TCD11808.1 phosphoglycolate phosphatase [Oricola cellulosilytica]